MNSTPLKISIIQLAAVGLYFLVFALGEYFGYGAECGLVYAGLFIWLEALAWPGALKSHLQDEKIRYLLITVAISFSVPILFFANLYDLLGSVSDGKDGYISGLADTLYFSVVTFTTLGYGEFRPEGLSRLASGVEALIGLGYFAFIIGVVGNIFYAKISKT